MEEKVDIRAKEKGKVKDEERAIREIAGIVERRVTSRLSVGM